MISWSGGAGRGRGRGARRPRANGAGAPAGRDVGKLQHYYRDKHDADVATRALAAKPRGKVGVLSANHFQALDQLTDKKVEVAALG